MTSFNFIKLAFGRALVGLKLYTIHIQVLRHSMPVKYEIFYII